MYLWERCFTTQVLRYIKTPYMNTNETYMNTKDAIEYKKHTIFEYSSVQDEDWIPDIAKE